MPGGSVVGLFWPELDQQRARAALSQSIYHLRRALGREIVASRGSEDIGIDPECVWCDDAAFERALADGDARRALDVYGGDLLPGFFLPDAPEWEQLLEAERRRLRARAAEAAWRLAEEAEAAANAAEAALRGRRALSLADDDEIQLARVMALLDRVAIGQARSRPERPLPNGSNGSIRSIWRPRHEPSSRGCDRGSPSRQRFARPTRSNRRRRRTPSLPAVVLRPPTRAAAVDLFREYARPPRSRWCCCWPAAIVWSTIPDRAAPAEVAAGSPADADSRVAVLPFVSSGSDRAVYLADGLTEQLISRLSSLSGLQIIARTSVLRLKDLGRSAEEIGRELGVGVLLEGSVDVSGDRVRITARLVNTATRQALWADDYEAAFRDVEDLESRIAEAVPGALRGSSGQRVAQCGWSGVRSRSRQTTPWPVRSRGL